MGVGAVSSFLGDLGLSVAPSVLASACDAASVVNESRAQREASKLRENRERTHDAAGALRHRVNQGKYAGMRGTTEGYALAALIEACAFELDQLPHQTQRAALAAVRELLDDDPVKPGAVAPLSAGDGH